MPELLLIRIVVVVGDLDKPEEFRSVELFDRALSRFWKRGSACFAASVELSVCAWRAGQSATAQIAARTRIRLFVSMPKDAPSLREWQCSFSPSL